MHAAADVVPRPYSIALQAESKAGGADVTHLVDIRPHLISSLNGLPYPPRDLNYALAIAVLPGKKK